MTWGDLLSQHTDWRRRALVWFWLLVIVLSGPAQAQSLRVTGDWEQFVLSESTGAWRSLGLFRVLESGGVYSMEPITQAPATNAINTKGLFNVRFSGSEWSFDSDWGEVGVAEFRMQRGAPGVYHGWSHLRGEQRDLNMWLLVR